MPDRLKAKQDEHKARVAELLAQGLQPTAIATIISREVGIGSRQAFRLVSEMKQRRSDEAPAKAIEAQTQRQVIEAEIEDERAAAVKTELYGQDGEQLDEEMSQVFGVSHWRVRANQLGKLEELERKAKETYENAKTPHQKTSVLRIETLIVQEQNKMLGVDKPPVLERRVVEDENEGLEVEEVKDVLALLTERTQELTETNEAKAKLSQERAEKERKLAELDKQRAEQIEAEMQAREEERAARDAQDSLELTAVFYE